MIKKQLSLIGSARSIIDGKKRAWLLDVFVDEGRRRVRIGSRMLALLIDYVEDGLATYVFGCDLPDNAEELKIAVAFYKHNNFSIDNENGCVGRDLVKSDCDFLVNTVLL